MICSGNLSGSRESMVATPKQDVRLLGVPLDARDRVLARGRTQAAWRTRAPRQTREAALRKRDELFMVHVARRSDDDVAR